MTLHIPRAPTAVARPYAGGSFRSPSEPVDWLPHALTFHELLFQPELGLAFGVSRHGSPPARKELKNWRSRRSRFLIFSGSRMPVMAGSASFNSASTMREPVGGRHPCTGNCLPIG